MDHSGCEGATNVFGKICNKVGQYFESPAQLEANRGKMADCAKLRTFARGVAAAG
jgi:hypothetical protein